MIKKLDRAFYLIQKHFCTAIYCFIFIMCVCQVFFRYILQIAAPWTEEFARVGMIWMTFLAAALGVRLQGHPMVDALVKKFPFRIRKGIIALSSFMIGLIGVILIIYGWKYVQMTADDIATSYRYPKSVFYIPIPISGVIIVIYSIANVWCDIASIITGKDIEIGGEPK